MQAIDLILWIVLILAFASFLSGIKTLIHYLMSYPMEGKLWLSYTGFYSIFLIILLVLFNFIQQIPSFIWIPLYYLFVLGMDHLIFYRRYYDMDSKVKYLIHLGISYLSITVVIVIVTWILVMISVHWSFFNLFL